MMMKRIKIRSENGSNAKVLRFDEKMPFGVLISKIVAKLELTDFQHNLTLEEQFDLWLHDGLDGGNGNLLEDTEEIDDGDQVLLRKKKKKSQATPASSEYNVVLPITADGLLMNVAESPSDGSTMFIGYRKYPDGTKGPAEVNNLIRQLKDRIIALNGVSTIGKSFGQVIIMLVNQTKGQQFMHVRFLDRRYMSRYGALKRQAEDEAKQSICEKKENDDSDDGVEDVTEQCLEQRRSARVKQEKNAELVTSSGDENDDAASSVENGGNGRKRKADSSFDRRSRR